MFKKISNKNIKELKFSSQSGEVSKLLLVLAIVILVAAVIVFLVIKTAEKPTIIDETPESTVVVPIYEQTLGDIKFIFESAINHGNTLYANQAKTETYSSSYQTDLTTTENFIEVKIGAQNIGRSNLEDGTWNIENIVDSEGREYVPIEDYSIDAWLPETDLCGSLLKPAFDPIPCVKIYEVSKKSTGLKIRVITGKNGNEVDENEMEKNNSALIDLIVQ